MHEQIGTLHLFDQPIVGHRRARMRVRINEQAARSYRR